jgi:hypothetical protein
VNPWLLEVLIRSPEGRLSLSDSEDYSDIDTADSPPPPSKGKKAALSGRRRQRVRRHRRRRHQPEGLMATARSSYHPPLPLDLAAEPGPA